MVNEDGEEVILRGYGLGNWMNQEGFLFGGTSDFKVTQEVMPAPRMDRGRTINSVVRELCGTEYSKKFWKQWYRNYIQEVDIRMLADFGYNSIRIPLCARVLLLEEPGYIYDEEVFEILDQVLNWCEKYRIYVILDMHAAVGAQSALPCDDGYDNVPHLFIDDESYERTIVLWEYIAKRYQDRTIVAGYDLLNEPLSLPKYDSLLPRLVMFYDDCIARIRAIDQKHMFFIEGHRFASRVDIFTRDFDPEYHNWAIHMHCYGSLPQLETFIAALEKGHILNVPIWMGETGGSDVWMTTFFEMLVQYHIGFNVWCYKAVSGADAAVAVNYSLPKAWKQVTEYAMKGGAKISYEKAQDIFDELLKNIRTERCFINSLRHRYILRQNDITIPAIGYDVLPGKGESFRGHYPYGNFSGYRTGDDMKIVPEKDFVPYERSDFAWLGAPRAKYGDWPHLELRLREGEFACYTIRDLTSVVQLALSYRSEMSCTVRISAGGDEVYYGELEPAEELTTVVTGMLGRAVSQQVKIAVEKGKVILSALLI